MTSVASTSRTKVTTATQPTIYNLPMTVAGTEYSQALSNATKKILIRSRDVSQIKFAFISGDTSLSWITIQPGAVYFEDNLSLDGAIIYLQSNKPAQVAEILEWT